MKIAIDGRLYGLENAGLGRYVINLISGLTKFDKKNNYSLFLREKYFKSLKLPANFEKIEAEFRHYSFAEQTKLPKLVNEVAPDLVHFPHFNVPLTYGGRYLVTIHDLLMHWQKGRKATTLPLYKYFLKRLGYKAVFKKAIKGSQTIIVPSQAVKKEILETYGVSPQKIKVIYEGVDKPIFTKSTKEVVFRKYKIKEPYFIYTGNAYPHKNLDIAVKAFSQLNKKNIKAYFYLISSRNVFTQKIEALIGKNKASGFVKLLGFVPDEEIAWLYKYSTAFLFPSLSEGFGLPGLEAMAAGTIALTSDIPVFREIYEDKSMYFNPYEIDSLVKALIDSLAIKREERKKLILESEELVKKYSWSKMVKDTLKLYQEEI